MSSELHEINTRLRQLEAQVAALTASNTIYLGGHEALTRLYTGHKIFVDTRDVGVCSHLMMEGRWEPWIEKALAETVKPGMRAVDAGANFGYYTLLLSFWVGDKGAVYAFEPNREICRKLRKSILVNGFGQRTALYELALLDVDGEADFSSTIEFAGGGSIGSIKDTVWTSEIVKVPTKRLDDLLPDAPSVDVMKIDVEGSEARVLRGACRLIERSPSLAIVMEFFPGHFSTVGSSPLDFLREYAAKGFSIAVIEPSGTTPTLAPEVVLDRVGGRLAYLRLQRAG